MLGVQANGGKGQGLKYSDAMKGRKDGRAPDYQTQPKNAKTKL